MSGFISGYDLLMPALYNAGVEKVFSYSERSLEAMNSIFERVPYRNMEMIRISSPYVAVSLAADFSVSGSRTACFSTVESLLCLENKGKKLSGKAIGIYFIVVEFMPENILEIIAGMKIPVLIVDDVTNIQNTIRDACMCSEIMNTAAIVLVFKNVLKSRMLKEERLVRTKTSMVCEGNVRKDDLLASVNSRHNIIRGNGKRGIILASDANGYISEIIENHPDYCLLKIDNPFPWPEQKMRYFLKGLSGVLIIESNSRYVSGMVEKTFINSEEYSKYKSSFKIRSCNISAFDEDDPGEKIYRTLLEYFSEGKRFLKEVGIPDEIARRKKPVLPEINHLMCAGCPMRIQIVRKNMLLNDNVRVVEDVYCSYTDCFVNSGIKYNKSLRDGSSALHIDMLYITTEPEHTAPYGMHTYAVQNTCSKMRSDTQESDGRAFRVNKRMCNMCGECIDMTGCPAIHTNGITAMIDAAQCTGCGVCSEVCRRGAII